MTLDKEEHRQLLLGLLNQAQVPGTMARLVVELQDALEVATIRPPDPAQED